MRSVNNNGSLSVHDKSSSISKSDPTIVCTAFKSDRFYLFTRREPQLNSEQGRDLMNERVAVPAIQIK